MKTLEDFLKVGKLYQFKELDKYAGHNLVFEFNKVSYEGIQIANKDLILILKLKINCFQQWKDYSLQILVKDKILVRYFSETSFVESMILDTFHLLS